MGIPPMGTAQSSLAPTVRGSQAYFTPEAASTRSCVPLT